MLGFFMSDEVGEGSSLMASWVARALWLVAPSFHWLSAQYRPNRFRLLTEAAAEAMLSAIRAALSMLV